MHMQSCDSVQPLLSQTLDFDLSLPTMITPNETAQTCVRVSTYHVYLSPKGLYGLAKLGYLSAVFWGNVGKC